MNYWIPVFTFGAAAALFLALYFRAEKAYQKNTMLRRLTPQKERRIERYPKTVFLRFLGMMGEKIMPKNEDKTTRFSEKLARAGFKAPAMLEIFYGLRGVCALTFGMAALFFLLVSRGLSGQTIILSYGSMLLGYYGPKWFLDRLEKKRAQNIFYELPDTLDILVICMNAGLSFDRSLLRVSQELEYLAPTLSKEFERYFFEVESGLPQQEALMNLANRNQVNSLTKVTQVLIQSARFGTDITNALRIHADSMRMERRQIAEEKAAKVSTKLVFPTVLFIMPALMLVVLGPASIRLIERLRFLDF